MGKRKRDEDYLLNKIKKLEDRLRRRHRDETSSFSESAWDHDESPIVDVDKDTSVTTENILSANQQPTQASISTESPAVPVVEKTNPPEENEVTLDADFLTLLGDAPKDESPVGPDVHKDIADRLRDVIKNGLKKDQKDKITEDCPFPGNCQLFKAPILNPEIKAAVSDMLQKKDASIEARQNQVGVALTSLSKALNILVQEKSEVNQVLVKHISNATRLLCDSHCIDTKLRRNFLVSTLNNKLKETLKDTKRDKFLFGEDLSEKLKATKAITKSSQDLKHLPAKTKPAASKGPPASSATNLNYNHPHPGAQQRKPVSSGHRAAGWTPTVKSQVARRPQSSSARGTARFKLNNRRA